MRTTIFLSMLTAAALLAGCPNATMPSDAASDGAAGSDMGVDASAQVAQLCQQYVELESHCGVPACAVADFQNECPTVLSHYRSDVLALVSTCIPESGLCPMDAGVTMMAPSCTQQMLESIMPTQAAMNAAAALCAACPSVVSSSTTPGDCVANFFTIGDGGTTGPGIFLRIVDDATANAIGTDCAIMPTDGGNTCSLSVVLCMLHEIGTNFSSSCSDAGRD